jgi:hypothetical protein
MSDPREQALRQINELCSIISQFSPSASGCELRHNTLTDASAPLSGADDAATDFDLCPIIPILPTLSEVPTAAVDCSLARLGETEEGVVVAARAAIIVDRPGQPSEVRLYKTGPLYLPTQHKTDVLYEMGKHLGAPDFFVVLDKNTGKPVEAKKGAADTAWHYADRVRAWLERLVQSVAIKQIQDGLVLLDGALTLSTRDVPNAFLYGLVKQAGQNGNAVLAVSKRSELEIGGRPVHFCLADAPQHIACYRFLSPLLRQTSTARADRILGQMVVVRFRAYGTPFRMDVSAAKGQTSDEAIHLLGGQRMRGGYPDALVRAHALSYFCSPAIAALRAQACKRYHLIPRSEPLLTPVFAPFAGRFK